MKIQFVYNNYEDVVEFDVAKIPTDDEVEAIYNSVYDEIEAFKEKYDYYDFDFWDCCRRAVMKHLELKDNPVVKTFYIDKVED